MSDSTITKRAIAEGFKEACRTKGFDRVNISDITGLCGLNRQTFYYHFEDKYELLSWIYYNECFAGLVDGITLENWHEHLRGLLETMEKDRAFYMGTVKSQPDHFSDYLFQFAHTLFLDAIEKLDDAKALREEDKAFYAEFYAYGCCGVVLSWVRGGMKQPAGSVATRMKKLAEDSEKLAYRRYMEEE